MKKINISQKNLMYAIIILSSGIAAALIIMALAGVKAKTEHTEFESNRILNLRKMNLLNEGK